MVDINTDYEMQELEELQPMDVQAGEIQEAPIPRATIFTRARGERVVAERRQINRPEEKRGPHIRQEESIFGAPCHFNENKLPTILEVLRRVFLSYNDTYVDNKISVLLQTFSNDVASEIIEIWRKTKIPLIEERSVKVKLSRLIEKYHTIKKLRHETPKFKAFLEESKQLFDIARCKCVRDTCNCDRKFKIPQNAIDFIFDQRGDREQSLPLPTPQHTMSRTLTVSSTTSATSSTSAEFALDVNAMGDSDFVLPTDAEGSSTAEERDVRTYSSRRNLLHFSMECDRYKISDRAASALACSLLKDFEMKGTDGTNIIVDRSKVRRERNLVRQNLVAERVITGTLRAISFDSRVDDTMTQERTDDNRLHMRKVQEQHISVLKWPGGVYLGHIDAEKKTKAGDTAEALLNFFREKNIDVGSLIAVCSDGEAKNTGKDNGILRNLEKTLKRPLHWFICMLHFNELPLRHLFETIDAFSTTGPSTSRGRISNALADVNKPVRAIIYPVKKFIYSVVQDF